MRKRLNREYGMNFQKDRRLNIIRFFQERKQKSELSYNIKMHKSILATSHFVTQVLPLCFQIF